MSEQSQSRSQAVFKAVGLDQLGLSEETGTQIVQLRKLIGGLRAHPDSAFLEGLREWYEAAVYDLLDFEPQAKEQAAAPSYTVFPLTHSRGTSTYNLNLNVDKSFGDSVKRIRDFTDVMLDRILQGQFARFVANAASWGLTWRRTRGLPFPHPLPYGSPPPSTPAGQRTEEAAVIEAAWHFSLSAVAPGVDLFIDRFDKEPSGNLWVTGQAFVNLYNDHRNFRIGLNAQALLRSGFDENLWSGTVAHEMLHNLGWNHPVGNYNKSIAMVNYELCIRTATGAIAEDVDFVR
jgi:hypothetical protein